ncbi:MAG: DciA family protein [Pseudomonadales bacterium]
MTSPGPTLRPLIANAERLLGLESLIRRFVSAEASIGSLKGGCLTLVTASSAEATRLRYQQRHLLAALRQADPSLGVNKLKVLVRPVIQKNPVHRSPGRRRLSRKSAKRIARAADYIQDQPLRKALLKLAR